MKYFLILLISLVQIGCAVSPKRDETIKVGNNLDQVKEDVDRVAKNVDTSAITIKGHAGKITEETKKLETLVPKETFTRIIENVISIRSNAEKIISECVSLQNIVHNEVQDVKVSVEEARVQTNALEKEGSGYKAKYERLKESDSRKTKNTLYSMIWISAVAGVGLTILAINTKNKTAATGAIGAFGLSAAALFLHEHFELLVLVGGIIFGLTVIYFIFQIVKYQKRANKNENTVIDLVQLTEQVKNILNKEAPQIREKVFGSSAQPLGIAQTTLTPESKKIVEEIRAREDVPLAPSLPK